MPAPAPVRLEGVTKKFGQDVMAVDRLDLEITPGSLVTLLGPSGCGKTTTLRMIAGLEAVSGGSILIDGQDVTRLAANHRDVTMVFQSYALFPHMSVFDNVAYGLRIAKVHGADLERRVADALATVGMVGLEKRSPAALSGGQQQRVALARSLVLEPRVLLFDEPLSNLDAKLRRRVRQEIRDLQQRLGITSVYVTHDQEEALAISDTIVVMQGGRIQQQGSPHELYTQPANRFVADFIGSANFLPGDYDGSSVRVGPYRFAYEQAFPKGKATVMVRPEAVRLATAAEAERQAAASAGGAEPGYLPATVKAVSYLGVVSELLLDTPLGELASSVSGEGRSRFLRGDNVQVTFHTAGVYLLPEGGETGA
ncbi:MAG TPA: ABC transporter ATP-binding protein [Trueperaceae bacterium]|nr:ABC transporter ATP-binding protein [Trueperaceae bacterium]